MIEKFENYMQKGKFLLNYDFLLLKNLRKTLFMLLKNLNYFFF